MPTFDKRKDARTAELLRRLPETKHAPHVGASELSEVLTVLDGLPTLTFPVNSAGELLDQLGDHRIEVIGMRVDAARMLKYMPAYYFPIASLENFVEKMSELVRENRSAVDVPAEIASLRDQLPELEFPIRTHEELFEQVGEKAYTFRGGEVQPKEIMHRVPQHIFPIESRSDFEAKIGQLMATRQLIVKD